MSTGSGMKTGGQPGGDAVLYCRHNSALETLVGSTGNTRHACLKYLEMCCFMSNNYMCVCVYSNYCIYFFIIILLFIINLL